MKISCERRIMKWAAPIVLVLALAAMSVAIFKHDALDAFAMVGASLLPAKVVLDMFLS
jgi:cytochrome c oxidase subunit IV